MIKLALIIGLTGVVVFIRPTRTQQTSPTMAPPQSTNAQIQKLEEQFKQIDAEFESVKVQIAGDKEKSAIVNIVGEPAVVAEVTADSASASRKTKSKKLRRFALDLSNVEVPDEYINEKINATFTRPLTGELPGVKVRQIGATANYEVIENYIYDRGTYSIVAPNGFVYDRASIPRIFWVIIDKDSLSNVAPLFHDLLYRNGGVLPNNQVNPYRKFSRKDTDDLFLELMLKSGVKKWRADLAYQAVRRFAALAWKSN
jgi:hypothetical protein